MSVGLALLDHLQHLLRAAHKPLSGTLETDRIANLQKKIRN